IEEVVREGIDADSTATLAMLAAQVQERFQVSLSLRTIQRILDKQKYTLKVTRLVPEGRNCAATIQARYDYVADLDANAPTPSHTIWVDESGFNLHLRRRQGRAPAGQPATVAVVNNHGPNISVAAALSSDGLVHHEVRLGAFSGALIADFLRQTFSILAER